jgi:hypothetical protein
MRNLNSLLVECLERDIIELLQIIGEVAKKLRFVTPLPSAVSSATCC